MLRLEQPYAVLSRGVCLGVVGFIPRLKSWAFSSNSCNSDTCSGVLDADSSDSPTRDLSISVVASNGDETIDIRSEAPSRAPTTGVRYDQDHIKYKYLDEPLGRTRTESSKKAHEPSTGSAIGLPLPIRGSSLFKHGASPHILNFLADNPDINVSIRQLSTVTPQSERATRDAVTALEANELIETFHRGSARRVHINRARLDKPDDPVRSIPQTEFQTPVRVAQHYIQDELDAVRGIILFGSVARGTADRQSDIDLWVLVEGDRMEHRHAANKLTQQLARLQIPPSVAVVDAMDTDFELGWGQIRETLESESQEWGAAERHAFEIVVETPQSILNQQDRVDAEQLFGEGITLQSTELLDRVKQELLADD